jgi:hypothetical protein
MTINYVQRKLAQYLKEHETSMSSKQVLCLFEFFSYLQEEKHISYTCTTDNQHDTINHIERNI